MYDFYFTSFYAFLFQKFFINIFQNQGFINQSLCQNHFGESFWIDQKNGKFDFFKISNICTRSHKVAHSSYSLLHKHPWYSELWAWQGRAKLLESWGPSLKNMYLTVCQFSKKKSHPMRPVEGLKLWLDFLCNVRIT